MGRKSPAGLSYGTGQLRAPVECTQGKRRPSHHAGINS